MQRDLIWYRSSVPTVRVRHVLALSLIVAGLAAACGIDFVGSAPLGGADGAADGPSSDPSDAGATLPRPCATVDAACLGPLPDPWQPIAMGTPGCGAGFTAATLLANPRSGAGSCACGACQPVGSFTCTGTTAVSGGNTCNDPPIADAPPGTCTTATAQHLRGTPPKAGGAIGCFAPNDAGSGVTTDALAVCVPGCAADFCAASSRCVIADGERACPSGFQLRAHAGAAADPGCPPCACEAGLPGTCRGTITAYATSNCTATGLVKTYDVGTCNTFDTGDYHSVLAKLVPPDASCSPVPTATAPVGDASLVGAKTICCQ